MSAWNERREPSATQRPLDHRSAWQRDKARILHSAAFRRLQAKTQIMGVGLNDFYRTRLTHSLEAAQIGTALVAQLKLNAPNQMLQALLPEDSLMEALCLAHDIGHPPFGHGGETALNAVMADFGGFEGNGQTLRIVGKLEPYTATGGMDLARRTLLGLLKYPLLQPVRIDKHKPCKAIYREDEDVLNWILAPLTASDRDLFCQTEQLSQAPFIRSRFKSLDASTMELADDIAYGVHDLEDAVVTGTVQQHIWQQELPELCRDWPPEAAQFLRQVGDKLFHQAHHIRKDAIGALVNRLITHVQWAEVLPDAQEPLIRYNAVLPKVEQQMLTLLKSFVYRHVILHPSLQQLEFRGQRIVQQLFSAFHSDPLRLLPFNTQQRWQLQQQKGSGERVIADYIAGMTDEYAERMHQRLYGRIL
ncbi:anti-phage deoxyguanosine triphosphatase [Rheinheimera sp. 4Y26]|uniref:anti-phage deoxyguanosine triphosphatase n=1 Tax=Rheinheimera sp. 4Y26 TaxID=2977811 RepID=UPI0021B0C745|nr:anti-phage deoxyguanosine triphosphatase [Rheinheimera sp. 4Y26]MCT6699468.1 anti-phage deoxyguanosine triphosphatase [Rheinheimera sp. 4Y26]